MSTLPLLSAISCISLLAARREPLLPESFDLGSPALAGATAYDREAQTYWLTAAGTNLWFRADEGRFAGRMAAGDFYVQARAGFEGEGGHAHRKLGVGLRAGRGGDAAHVSVAVHADGLTSLQFRRAAGALTEELVSPVSGANVIRLERRGRTYLMSVARFGDPLVTTVLEDGPDLGDEVIAGIFLCSHDAAVRETAWFRNVAMVRPAPPDLRPYRDFLPSDLEVLDVAGGQTRRVHRVDGEMQSPNWSSDGRTIDFNRQGRIHRLDLGTGAMREIDLGFAVHNNNDHVLSPDGRWLGLSHHAPERGRLSLVYVAPAAGGEPRLVTPSGPSYLHGWSPDGRSLLYTAKREGKAFNIHRISVEGGPEVRLSDGPGLDDGPEYSPDGEWIYFNSDCGGRMQIWRMRPDGTAPERLTSDGLNDWFPHVSPDGRWIVFVSFGPEVPAGEHPLYKPVYLRLLPAAGGVPRVVAYLYGGQGTLNVPSWSPDSAHVAFVANGGVE